MGFLPQQTPILHIVWEPSFDDAGKPIKDRHGNQTGSYGTPIPRMIYCWWPLERSTWQVDPVDPDVVARIEYDIHLLVEQPMIYKVLDRVVVDNNTYQVQGLPTHWRSALPFPTAAYGSLIGGEVHCRKVSNTGVLAGQ
jgi:hypothetical protein